MAKTKAIHNKTPVSSERQPVIISRPGRTRTQTFGGQQRLEQYIKGNLHIEDEESVHNNISPTLERLRLTPGRILREQQTLIDKHAAVRRKTDELNVGGGVAIWPEMEKMRLSQKDTLQLIVVAITLLCSVLVTFQKVHGDVIRRLLHFHMKVKNFHKTNSIQLHTQKQFHISLLAWHQNYRLLLEEVHNSFDVSNPSATYIVYILFYIFGMVVLVYYLYDNMFAKSKLSPKRIRRWVCLLVVIATWTFALLYLLATSYVLETSIQNTIHQLREVLGEVILRDDLDKTDLNNVILYWNNRCLPPVATGTLSIMGLVAVQDLMYYLQCYSLPIITVLVTPVVKLIVSLFSVYHIKKD